MRARFPILLILASLAGCSPLAFAQTPALGTEFGVNSYTTAGQQRAAVASRPNGEFVVTWQSMGQDGSGYGIVARRLAPAGGGLPGEFPVNTYTTDYQYLPAIASDDTGAFVIAWASDGDGSYTGIRARRFGSLANPLGDDFQVNTYTTDLQTFPRVATNGNGFVVVWQSNPGLGSSNPGQDGDGSGIFGQRYDSTGTPAGGEFQVNVYTTGNQVSPAVAMDSTGAFVVVWAGLGAQDPLASDVFARRYDADGSPVGGEIPVNVYTTGYQSDPDIAMDATGEFVVVWHSYDPAGATADIVGRRFSADATPMTPDFPINAYTTGQQRLGRIGMAADGSFIVTWEDWFQIDEIDVFARRFEANGKPRGSDFLVNAYTTGLQYTPVVAVNDLGALICWTSDFQDGSGQGVFARDAGFPSAKPMAVDARASSGTSNVNGVLETGETVAVDPAWKNTSGGPLPLSGGATNFTGPGGPTYMLDDSSTGYGVIAAGATADCFTSTGNCLEVTVSGVRPAPHWDATFEEILSTAATKTWTLHVGESFPDVPTTQGFYAFIENLFHNRITGGCGGGNYCPDTAVTRGQIAVFLLKAEHGADFVPPPCTGVFPDVPCPSLFADWIEQLAAEGITGGCGNGNYCPDNPVTRAQMAVFLLKAEHGSTYTPPACMGTFGDVPCPSQFADWIEQLAAEGITGGCGGGNYCPDNPNTRGQMAVFLVKTFGLQLYGAD